MPQTKSAGGLDPMLEDFLFMQRHGFWSSAYQGRMFKKSIRWARKWWLIPCLAFPLGDMVGLIFHIPLNRVPFWIYLLCFLLTSAINIARIKFLESLSAT